MILRESWMTNNGLFGVDYPNPDLTIQTAKERYEYQRDYSAEGYEASIDGTTERIVLQEHTNPINKEKETKKVFCDTTSVVKTGSIIDINEINQKYMVVSNIDTNRAYLKTLVKLCNAKIVWIDESGNIKIYDGVREILSRASAGTTENKYGIFVDRENSLIVPSNEDTLKLRERNNVRFIFDETCFLLHDTDRGMANGLIYLSLKEDEINFETDKQVDIDGTLYWIADYTSLPNFIVEIEQSDSQVMTGNTLQLSAQTTKDGLIISENITWSSSDENIATVDGNGLVTTIADGSVVITATMINNSNVSDSINITVASSIIDDIVYSVSPDIDGILLTDTKIFTVAKLNNGVEEVETFTFSVDGSTTANSGDYEFTIIDGNSFSIKNNNDGKMLAIKIIPDNDVGSEFIVEYNLEYFY